MTTSPPATAPDYRSVGPYLVKTPWWMKKLWSSYEWHINTNEKVLYLSFDDGPDPIATPFVLDELRKYGAKATFFCIGKNVVEHPDIYKRILDEGHSVGNHTYNHFNGWETKDEIYLKDVAEAAKHIQTSLFRPPYGRIGKFQAKNIQHAMKTDTRIIMWTVLSGDFDSKVTKEKCLQNVVLHAGPGSIVVFHDSEKAFPLVQYALPQVLQFFDRKGYRFDKI